jgi:hypothetical protein
MDFDYAKLGSSPSILVPTIGAIQSSLTMVSKIVKSVMPPECALTSIGAWV